MWLIIAKSESGDEYKELFPNPPTSKELREWCHDTDGCPDEEGPGNYGSYIHIQSLERV